MQKKLRTSLHIALWLVIAIATIPALVLAFIDYQDRRREAVHTITDDVVAMLAMARSEEQSAIREVQILLGIMARADEMQVINPQSCNELARRLLRSVPNISNIGAVLPDGTVFCSGKPSGAVVTVNDRKWFMDTLTRPEFGPGQFLIGRISGQPGITFPYALRDAQGKLRMMLFASSHPDWLDQLIENYRLREGWEATLITRAGQIITHYPDPEHWRLQQAEPALFNSLKVTFDQPGFVGELTGFDGIPRLYGVAPLASTGADVFVAIGAPTARSLAQVNRDALQRLAILVIVTALSALFSRFFVYRLIERSTSALLNAVRSLAQGNLGTRVSGLDAAREFEELGSGLNAMAEALEKREAELQRFSSAIEQSPESVVMTDLDAKIIYANTAFTKVSGYSLAEVLGQNPRILQSGSTPKGVHDDLWATLSSGKVWRGEFKNKRKDGSHYDELATISPIIQPDGQITHYVAVKQDITERNRIAGELEAHRDSLEALVHARTYELSVAKEAAEVANQAKTAFLANMSHEIRTPLNAILGLGYLLGQSPLSQDQHDKLDKIAGAGKHLLRVINDILDLAKIEAGRIELRHDVFNPVAALEEVGALIGDAARKKGLSIVIDADTLPLRVSGDATRLRQVLLNLAGNAVKFTLQGRVTLRGEVLAQDKARYLLRFTVEDTGPGIPPTKLPQLFAAFKQLDNTSQREHGGTGLGLAITRHLARLMGGEVGVESTPGEGSRFWLTIRVDRGNAGQSNGSLAPGVSAGDLLKRRLPPVHVLLAEDGQINREVAVELLTNVGCQVDVAVDGEKAAKMAAGQSYDVILMDIQMPILNGIEATALIRKLPEHQATPILAMTANVLLDDKERCLKNGLNDFIAKPFEPEQLYATMLRWLPEAAGATDQVLVAEPAYLPMPLDEMALEIKRFAGYLATGDIEAGSLFLRLEEHLAHLYGKEMLPLKEAVTGYDFEAASRLLAQLTDTRQQISAGQPNGAGGN